MFKRFINSVPLPMAIASEEDGYHAMTWNDAWYRAFNYSSEEAGGRSGAEIGLWADSQEWKKFVSLVTTQHHVSEFMLRIRCRDGAIRTCDVYGQITGKI